MEVFKMPNGEKLEIVTTNQLAEEFGVRPGTISYWRTRGMPYYSIKRYRRRTVRYPYRAVLEWVKEWSEYEYDVERRTREYREQVLDKQSALMKLQAEYKARIASESE